jgi:phytoene dehydrogenase-like protein
MMASRGRETPRPGFTSHMPMPEVVIVGAGLAGLACAETLDAAGVRCAVFEASDGVGGRARTDRHQGFLLDRGFQVLLTAYPEAQRFLDYKALELRSFIPGALIRRDGRFQRLADPLRQPSDFFATLLSPIGTLADSMGIARLWLSSGYSSPVEEFRGPKLRPRILSAGLLRFVCGKLWFGRGVDSWRHLRSYYIPQALPEQSPGAGGLQHRNIRLGNGVYICGDHRDSASINGALLSGRRAGEAILE